MKKFIIILLGLTFSLHGLNVVKEYRYMASDSDSKTSAKKQALKTLKNLVIEERGAGMATRFIQEEEIEDESISRELSMSVKSFTNAFIKSKVIDESWDGTSYWLKASIDIDETGLYEKTKLHYKKLQAKSKSEELERLLNDISSKKKLDKLIKKTITLEFTQGVGSKTHLKILRVFSNNKIYNKRYRNFLIETLKTVKYPSWDIRTKPILGYLQGFKAYTKNERKVLLSLLENTEVAFGGRYLEFMLFPLTKSCDEGAENLMEDYFELLDDGKVGLPIYSNLNYEFNYILNGYVSTVNSKCSALGSEALLEILKSDSADTLTDEKWVNLMKALNTIFKKSNIKSSKKLLPLVEICAEKLPINGRSKKAISSLYSSTNIKIHPELTDILEPKIRLIYTKEKLYSKDIEFCISNAITIPNKVFTLKEYYKKLKDKSQKSKRNNIVEAIVFYGKDNGGKNYQAYLSSAKYLQEYTKDDYHLEKLLRVMDEVKYNDKESVKLLTKLISSQNPNLSKRAKRYLLQSNNAKKRVNLIIDVIPYLDFKQQKRVITFLSNFKQDAFDALDQLDKYRKSPDTDVKYAVEWLEKQLKKKGYS